MFCSIFFILEQLEQFIDSFFAIYLPIQNNEKEISYSK